MWRPGPTGPRRLRPAPGGRRVPHRGPRRRRGHPATLLDPDVDTRADGRPGRQGSAAAARFFAGRAQAAHPALVDGAIGIVVMVDDHPKVVLRLTFAGDRIRTIDATLDETHIRDFEIALLPPVRDPG